MIYLFIALSAIFYHLGGLKGFNTKIRDFGVPLVGFLTILVLGRPYPWWVHFLAFGVYFASLTTYWDKLFGYDNFYFHGFICALAYLPYALAGGIWFPFLARAVVCAAFMGLLNQFYSGKPFSATVEECGRGVILTGTLLFFS